MEDVKKHLYTARWAITEAIEHDKYHLIDHAFDSLIQARADSITGEDTKYPAVPDTWEGLISAYADRKDIDSHFKVASVAQFILESGRGTSVLSKKYNNYAGLKWREALKPYGSPFMYDAQSESEPQEFTRFPSVSHFIDGYWAFIGRDHYNGWSTKTTALSYIEFLHEKGYATDPEYVRKVSSLFDEARKLLNAAGDDIEEPERPDKSKLDYEMPVIKTLPADIRFDNQGSYRTPTGRASGLVVHYTVSGRSPRSAEGVARYLASKNLGCLVMDEDGVIYAPQGWDWTKQWDDHAGVSYWNGKTSVSRYFYGMEICNWGKLDEKTKPRAGETRVGSTKDKNRKPGEYEKYTPAQERALINFCLWQLDVNPEFQVRNICGHDECAPDRKWDPGYSLSTNMASFRELLAEIIG